MKKKGELISIIVSKKDLQSVINEVFEEAERVGAEGIQITLHDNKVFFGTIECGGMGYCGDFDSIRALTEDEILDLP